MRGSTVNPANIGSATYNHTAIKLPTITHKELQS